MKRIDIASIAQFSQGRLRSGDAGRLVTRVNTDSRSIQSGEVFLALVGERFDAHDFLEQATEAGAGALMVSNAGPWPQGVDVILVPSATETVLGVERVGRCASARAVELGCVVGVCHLTGKTEVELIDVNVGRTGVYWPSQAAFRDAPRWSESEIIESGIHKQRLILDPKLLQVMRRMPLETNPSLLKRMPAFELVRD